MNDSTLTNIPLLIGDTSEKCEKPVGAVSCKSEDIIMYGVGDIYFPLPILCLGTIIFVFNFIALK